MKLMWWGGAVLGLLVAGWFLSLVFSGEVVLSQGFSFGLLMVRWYGVVLAIAAASAYVFLMNRGLARGYSQSFLEHLSLYTVIFGFVGARLYHVVSELSRYAGHWVDAVKVWQGGLSIYGAVLGGAVGLLYFLWRRGEFSWPRLLELLDVVAPAVLLGQIIGRLGNFFNYELYGYPTTVPWKMFVPEQFRAQGYELSSYYHPLFLYEMLGNVLILTLLLSVERSKKIPSGSLFFLFILMYNALRFFLEFLRLDTVIIAGFRANAFVSLGLFLLGFVLFLVNFYYGKQRT